MPSDNIRLGLIAPGLHDMRMVCLLKVVTPAWVINTVPSSLVIYYTRCCDSFEILQDKVKCLLLFRPARLVRCALNKHFAAPGGPINVSFMYIT